MKRQNGFVKFILTICLLIGTINLWTYYDPITAWKTIGSWKVIDLFNRFFGFFYAVAVIITLIRIWKNNKSQREEKISWTFLTILLPIIFGTYYIWTQEEKILNK